MQFKEGQVVYSIQYSVCRIKKISGTKCSVVTNQPVHGSLVHIVNLDTLRFASKEVVEWFESQEDKKNV